MPVTLTEEHRRAAARGRRIVVNFDVTFAINVHHRKNSGAADLPRLIDHLFEFADAAGSQIDAVWWNWGEGNQAPYPSGRLPLYDHPLYRGWAEEGTDIVGILLEETRRRGLEAFFSHRMNGSDNDLGPFAVIPAKAAHPEWTFRTPWCTHEHNRYWDFSHPEVREYVLENLREVAGRWPFDGFELDFARGVCFPEGTAWLRRDCMTGFVRSMREMLLQTGKERGRPMLLAARVPENLAGCRFDGLDVETWAREELVDLLVPGVRSLDVDLVDFRRICRGTQVRLYPSIDDHHASDGYQNPGIELFRGLASTWRRDGADGLHTFNFNFGTDAPYAGQDWRSHLQAYRELGSPDTIRGKDKLFVVQRRGGGHGPSVIPNPENWYTPRYWYANTNMLAPLPADLDNSGRTDTLLPLRVGDDVEAEAEAASLSLRLLLSDPDAARLPESERLPPVEIAAIGHAGGLMNEPPATGIAERIEVRLNNCLLERCEAVDGWLVFPVEPRLAATGENLAGVRLVGGREGAEPMRVEKLELLVRYSGQG